jgi:hypothetical protein
MPRGGYAASCRVTGLYTACDLYEFAFTVLSIFIHCLSTGVIKPNVNQIPCYYFSKCIQFTNIYLVMFILYLTLPVLSYIFDWHDISRVASSDSLPY